MSIGPCADMDCVEDKSSIVDRLMLLDSGRWTSVVAAALRKVRKSLEGSNLASNVEATQVTVLHHGRNWDHHPSRFIRRSVEDCEVGISVRFMISVHVVCNVRSNMCSIVTMVTPMRASSDSRTMSASRRRA